MKRFHYAWVICGCSAVLFFCNMGICYNLMSVYLPLILENGLSASVASSLISVRCFAGVIAMFTLPWFFRVFSYRTGLTLSLVLAAVSSLLHGLADSAVLYYIASVFSGFAFGYGTTAPISILLDRWFKQKYGTALGICSTGSGFALILLPPLVTKLAMRHGLAAAFYVQGAFLLAMAALVFLLLRSSPEEMGITPFGSEGAASAKKTGTAHTASALCLALLLIAATGLGGAGGTIPGHFSVLLQTSGYSMESSAFFLSFFGICMAVSKILLGAAADRIGARLTTVCALGVMGLGCVSALLLRGGTLSGIVFTLTLGLGFGVTSVGVSLWATDFSSHETYPRNVKNLQIAMSVGSILIASIPGFLFERTGEYRSSFLLLGVLSALTLLFLLFAYRFHNVRHPQGSGTALS